jgi:hypothetical protein
MVTFTSHILFRAGVRVRVGVRVRDRYLTPKRIEEKRIEEITRRERRRE